MWPTMPSPGVCDDVKVTDHLTPSPASLHPRHRRTVLKIILTTQLVLALLTGIAVYVGYNRLDGNIEAGDAIAHMAGEKPESSGPLEPLNILVMGSDSRDGDGNDIDGLSGGGERSDTTILVHVSANREEAYGISIPRDALVDRPDCIVDAEKIPGAEDTMFNTAFSVGGQLCTVQTVEAITDIYIDHFITLDFNGFKDMVDAVDGVEVCIPEEVNDPERQIFLDAGTQVLQGDEALDYVRERYRLSATGDIGRMRRQQAFLASMINKVLSAQTLSQPTKVYSFLEAVTSSIKVDEDIDSIPALANLGSQFQNTGLSKIRFVTVPVVDSTTQPGRLEITDAAKDLWRRIRNDLPLGPNFGDQSISADDSVGTASVDPDPSAGASAPGSTTDPTTPTGSPSAAPELSQKELDQAAARRAAGLCV